jgi:hypothetical protein
MGRPRVSIGREEVHVETTIFSVGKDRLAGFGEKDKSTGCLIEGIGMCLASVQRNSGLIGLPETKRGETGKPPT